MLLIAMYAMLYLLFYTFYSMNYILSNWFRISFVGSGDLIFGNAEYLFAYDDKKCPVQNRKQVTGLSKIQLRNFKILLKTSPGSEEPVKKTSAWVSYSNVATNTLHVCWQHSITNTDQQLPLTQDMKKVSWTISFSVFNHYNAERFLLLMEAQSMLHLN